MDAIESLNISREQLNACGSLGDHGEENCCMTASRMIPSAIGPDNDVSDCVLTRDIQICDQPNSNDEIVDVKGQEWPPSAKHLRLEFGWVGL